MIAARPKWIALPFLLGSLPIALAPMAGQAAPSAHSHSIHVAKYGALPNDGINDLSALRSALGEAIKLGNCELFIPPGRYEISAPEAVRLQDEVMSGRMGNPQDKIFNRDYKYVTGLDFTGADHITVNAKGVELLVDGWMEPISLQQCRNVTLNGLAINSKRQPNSSGAIIATGNGTVDVKFADWCPVTASTPFLRLMVFDEEQKSFCGSSIYHNGAELIGPQTIRFKMGTSQCKVGRSMVSLHGFHFRPAILIYQASDTVLNDVSIHAQPGMGVVGHMAENVTMERLRIVPVPGHHVPCNTDATHFVSCRGLIRFHECEFAGQGDDSTNVHCFYTDIVSKPAEQKCVIDITRRFETHSVKRDVPRIGDRLAIVDRKSLVETGYLTVTSVEPSQKDYSCTVGYEGKLPDDIRNYTIANITASPALEFIDCKIRSHRARSVLVKTRKVKIEGCTFENTTGTCIHIGAEGNWMEGVASADVVIRNNRIFNCGLGGANDGTIDEASGIAIHVNANDRSVQGLHKRILIENNTITHGEHAITIKGAEDVTVRHNTFTNIRQKAIVSDASRRVWCYDNQGAADQKEGESPALPIPADVKDPR